MLTVPERNALLAGVAGAAISVGIAAGVYHYETERFNSIDAVISPHTGAGHGRELVDTTELCKDRFVYAGAGSQKGLPGTEGNTLTDEQYNAEVGASLLAGIVMMILSGVWGIFLCYCRICKCACCGGTTPTKGCCGSKEAIQYTPKDIMINKAGLLIVFVVIIVGTGVGAAGSQLFTEGFTGLFAKVLEVGDNLHKTTISMDNKLQTINMTDMKELRTAMGDAVTNMKNVETQAIQIDGMRNAAMMIALIFPVLAGVIALIGILAKSRKIPSCLATFLGFVSLFMMWATYGLHAPFARVGNDLCYTIDQSLCGGKLGDGVCFLSAPVKSVSDSMDKELDKTLGSVRNVTAQFGYTFTGKATDTAEVTVAALKAVDTPMEADLKLFNTPAMKDKFYCTDLTGNCRANKLAQCQKELHPKISCNTGAAPCVPFVETPGATKPNHSLYKICDALIVFESATVIGHFTDIGKWTNMITVMYGVIADLAPWGKCDYVVDIFSVMKTLLCDKMVRGIDYIQVSGLLQGIFLIPFVIITTSGWKKWGKDSNAAAVTPA